MSNFLIGLTRPAKPGKVNFVTIAHDLLLIGIVALAFGLNGYTAAYGLVLMCGCMYLVLFAFIFGKEWRKYKNGLLTQWHSQTAPTVALTWILLLIGVFFTILFNKKIDA